MNDFQRVESLFELGADLDTEAREALLAQQCGDRPDLADKVRNMWQFDQAPNFDFGEIPVPDQLLIPEAIGPYKVLGLLGHGGMGAVYKAEQEQPRRLVALKVMHMGLASPEYLHRFMAEQKALALMAHLNIAVVYDAGFTADNSPYFAMEYLDGKSITHWCDDQKLNVCRRLALFLSVCDGVSHAHQKGVVHRDLHPENLIVISQNGEPVPKIIDFGIAKLEGSDQEPGFRTRLGTVMGTPEFMSPEQASGLAADNGDTRSDVYALGCVLYKLLVGVTPLGVALQGKSMTQMVRIIQKGTITRPSARIGADGEAVALNRGCNAADLRQTIQDDLDWIVMKALERDPERRYGSVADLSRDLEYYLNGFPVSARPPSRMYLMRKFVSRNRYVVGAAGVFLFMLIAGFTTTVITLVRSLEAEAQAQRSLNRLEKVNHFYLEIFRSADPYRKGKDVSGVDLLKLASGRLENEYFNEADLEIDTRIVLGKTFVGMGVPEAAKLEFNTAYQLSKKINGPSSEDTLTAQLMLGYVACYYDSDYAQAKEVYLDAYNNGLKRFPENHPIMLRLSSRLAEAMMYLEETDEAKQIIDETFKTQMKVLPPDSDDIRNTRAIYGLLLMKNGDYDRAGMMFLANYALVQKSDVLDETLLDGTLTNLASVLRLQGRYDDAVTIYEELLPLRRKYLGDGHPDTLVVAMNYAVALETLGKYDDAISVLQFYCDQLSDTVPKTQQTVLQSMHNLGALYKKIGEFQMASDILLEVLALKREVYGGSNGSTLTTYWIYGEVIKASGDVMKADHVFCDIVTLAENNLGVDHPITRTYVERYSDFRAWLTGENW